MIYINIVNSAGLASDIPLSIAKLVNLFGGKSTALVEEGHEQSMASYTLLYDIRPTVIIGINSADELSKKAVTAGYVKFDLTSKPSNQHRSLDADSLRDMFIAVDNETGPLGPLTVSSLEDDDESNFGRPSNGKKESGNHTEQLDGTETSLDQQPTSYIDENGGGGEGGSEPTA
jgi:hypothetical protein